MRISTLVDTTIVIDVLGSGPFSVPSLKALVGLLADGDVVVSAIVWAELAPHVVDEGALIQEIAWLRLRREAFPFAAAYPAGQAHRRYRQRGGGRERTLPDFLIGAHALAAGHRLLTRDQTRYRIDFPDLDTVSPEGSS